MNAGILREVQSKERDEGCQGDYDEEQEAGDHGNLPGLRHKDVQDREVVSVIDLKKFYLGAGFTRNWVLLPFYYV